MMWRLYVVRLLPIPAQRRKPLIRGNIIYYPQIIPDSEVVSSLDHYTIDGWIPQNYSSNSPLLLEQRYQSCCFSINFHASKIVVKHFSNRISNSPEIALAADSEVFTPNCSLLTAANIIPHRIARSHLPLLLVRLISFLSPATPKSSQGRKDTFRLFRALNVLFQRRYVRQPTSRIQGRKAKLLDGRVIFRSLVSARNQPPITSNEGNASLRKCCYTANRNGRWVLENKVKPAREARSTSHELLYLGNLHHSRTSTSILLRY